MDNNYDRVLDSWEESKITGRMDTDSYTIVIAMCEKLGSSEAALALREDMRSHWWTGEEGLGITFKYNYSNLKHVYPPSSTYVCLHLVTMHPHC